MQKGVSYTPKNTVHKNTPEKVKYCFNALQYHSSHLLVSQEPPLAVLDRKPTAHLLGADVSSVLNDDVLLDAADQAPELLLYQLCRNHLGGGKRSTAIKPVFHLRT